MVQGGQVPTRLGPSSPWSHPRVSVTLGPGEADWVCHRLQVGAADRSGGHQSENAFLSRESEASLISDHAHDFRTSPSSTQPVAFLALWPRQDSRILPGGASQCVSSRDSNESSLRRGNQHTSWPGTCWGARPFFPLSVKKTFLPPAFARKGAAKILPCRSLQTHTYASTFMIRVHLAKTICSTSGFTGTPPFCCSQPQDVLFLTVDSMSPPALPEMSAWPTFRIETAQDTRPVP